MPTGIYKRTDETRRKLSESGKNKIFTEEHKKNLSLSHKGYKWTEKQRERYKEAIKSLGGYAAKLAHKRIMEEVPELEKQGFRCVPILEVIPDIIAIKDGKFYAIEVEYGKPNYSKYGKGEYKKFFEDIIWIMRKSPKKRG